MLIAGIESSSLIGMSASCHVAVFENYKASSATFEERAAIVLRRRTQAPPPCQKLPEELWAKRPRAVSLAVRNHALFCVPAGAEPKPASRARTMARARLGVPNLLKMLLI